MLKPISQLRLTRNQQFTIHLSSGALARLRAAVLFSMDHRIQDTFPLRPGELSEDVEWETLKRALFSGPLK